jgi:hypothetical protein
MDKTLEIIKGRYTDLSEEAAQEATERVRQYLDVVIAIHHRRSTEQLDEQEGRSYDDLGRTFTRTDDVGQA